MTLVYGVALIIIVSLVIVAIYLHWTLFRVQQRQQIQLSELEIKKQKVRQQANQSIQIICRAYLQGQVGAAEASLRVCGLLDQLQVSVEQRSEWIAFAKMADAVRHIPILEKWNALPMEEQRNFEKFIEQKESELAGPLKLCAEKMLDRIF